MRDDRQPEDRMLTPDEIVESEKVFQGSVVSLYVDTVRLGNGSQAVREKVTHPGAVAVVAENEDGLILLIRQYRHAAGEVLWEIPAGKLEPDEEPIECARRELAEETGYVPDRIQKVSSFYTAPGFASEVIHLFFAEGLSESTAHQDDDESIVLSKIPFETCIEMIQNGQIRDGKTIIGLLMYNMLRKQTPLKRESRIFPDTGGI